MAVKKIELAWITVSDWERAKKFFTEVVGLEMHESHDEFKWAELGGKEGGALLGIGPDSEDNPVKPGHNAVITFTVDDIATTKAAMEAKGVTFIGDIVEVPGAVKLALFSDPDGNRFQLVQHVGG